MPLGGSKSDSGASDFSVQLPGDARSLGNPFGNLRAATGAFSTAPGRRRNALTRYHVVWHYHKDTPSRPTDQKVGGSNPSERARKVQVTVFSGLWIVPGRAAVRTF